MDSEMKKQSGTELVKTKQLKDMFHDEHRHHQPLVFYKDQEYWDQIKERTLCSACDSPMSGESYSCARADCEYRIHKECGEIPCTIQVKHFFCCQNPSLSLSFYKRRTFFDCPLCLKTSTTMISYKCSNCNRRYHIKCAKFSLEYSKTFKHDAHPRPLLLFQNHTDLLQDVHCNGCDQPLVNSIYISDDFKIFLHQKCAESPSQINLPCHRNHKSPLVLDFHKKTKLCKLCRHQHRGYFYSCSLCNIDIHMSCASLPFPPVIKDETHHQHPFNLFWRQDPFICDACGIEGGCASYVCFICHIQVHPKCASVPPIIKITRHAHPVFHKYFIEEEELEKLDCRICFREAKTKHGSYSCSKPECNYIVHVECATEDSRLYRIIDRNEPIEDSEAIESSITRILEVNESGDAVKVKHCFHEHCLTLGEEINENDDDKHCDGCVQSITGKVYYYCSECDFLLHKSCAELPRKKQHFYHEHLLNLEPPGIFQCDNCSRICNCFLYECGECEIFHCLNCENISDTVTHPDHKHLLFFDPKYEGKCIACGYKVRYAYRCTKNCDFALDYKCITLPHAVRHKCDKVHHLKLSSTDGKDDPEQCYCDVCEEERDPGHWFYHCSICDTSAHRKCALGIFPFIKIGSKIERDDHPHLLTFVQKIYYYPECAICHKPCQDVSLECATCNYLVHWNCK